jgi:hypothetical protein
MYVFKIDVRDGKGIFKVAVTNYTDGKRLEKLVKDVGILYDAVEYVKDQLDRGQSIDPDEIQAMLNNI